MLVPTCRKLIKIFIIFHSYSTCIPCDRLRWSRGSVLAFGTQVRGFKPSRSRRIFKGEKILSTPSFGGEVCPMSQICGMQKISRITWKSNSRRNLSEHFSPTKSYTFRYWRSLASLDVKAPSGEGGNV